MHGKTEKKYCNLRLRCLSLNRDVPQTAKNLPTTNWSSEFNWLKIVQKYSSNTKAEKWTKSGTCESSHTGVRQSFYPYDTVRWTTVNVLLSFLRQLENSAFSSLRHILRENLIKYIFFLVYSWCVLPTLVCYLSLESSEYWGYLAWNILILRLVGDINSVVL